MAKRSFTARTVMTAVAAGKHLLEDGLLDRLSARFVVGTRKDSQSCQVTIIYMVASSVSPLDPAEFRFKLTQGEAKKVFDLCKLYDIPIESIRVYSKENGFNEERPVDRFPA